MNKEEFIKEIEKINVNITQKQLDQLDKYYKLLIEWNKKINLTGIVEEDMVYLKHFYDSLTINKIINLKEETSLCDIGTGAGFPGMVLKIVYPHLNITLIDSLNKRINFLQEVKKELGIENLEIYHARAEEFAKTHIETYDIVTARAVANLSTLLEYSIPMVKINKYFIGMKSNISQELESSTNAITKLKCKLIKIEEFKLPIENSLRTIIKIQKCEKTPSKYPRSNKEIKNNPL